MSVAEEKLSLYGTHGTSKTRAMSILESRKFVPSDVGLFGNGVYFWEASENAHFAKQLAANWWRSASSSKFDAYKGDKDKGLAIIKANIIPCKKNFFDTTTVDFLDDFDQAIESLSFSIKNKEDSYKLRAVLVKKMEQERGQNFSVVRVEVEVPGMAKGEENPPVVWLVKKQAPCYVVRHQVDEIIRNIEQIG